MKLETIKSVILSTLIVISLLLTLALWSYQPDYKLMKDMPYAEADIGGKDDVQIKDLVTPTSFIFHQYDRVYGFTDPKQGRALYQDMQNWQLDNLKEKSAQGPPKDNNQIELIFPDRLPMELADSLFTFRDDTTFPDWSFQRIFITFVQDSTMEVEFLSASGNKRATAVINNAKQYDRLWQYMRDKNDLSEYTKVDTSGLPIYIPKNSLEMKERKLAMKEIDLGELVSALFSTPETVRRNTTKTDEVYYTDGFRGMRVKGDGKSIQYFNPLHEEYEKMDTVDLLEVSHNNINEQKGWTGDFSLDTLNPSNNLVRYRMYYAGYPVFSSNLAIIEQEWHDEELYKYSRPIVRFSVQPEEKTVDLKSGDKVIEYIKEESDYDMEELEDIKPGYHLTNNGDENSFYMTMEPVWYLKHNGIWQELDFGDTSQEEGGS